MPPVPYIPGYLEYLAAVLLPGVGLGELLGIWPKDGTLSERFAYAFGVGLCVDTLVMVVKTSGLAVAGVTFRGIGLPSIYLLLGFGLGALLFSVGWRRMLGFGV